MLLRYFLRRDFYININIPVIEYLPITNKNISNQPLTLNFLLFKLQSGLKADKLHLEGERDHLKC